MSRATSRQTARLLMVILVTVFVVSACSVVAQVGDRLSAAAPPPEVAASSTEASATASKPAARTTKDSATKTTKSAAKGGGSAAKTAKPARTVVKLKPRPKRGPFQMNLFRKGDFVHQATKDWCVAGSTATMMNIMEVGDPRRSARFQKRLYERGRQLSPQKDKLGPIGVDLTGWKELLNTGGYGPYVVTGSSTLEGAIHKAARALRLTSKPVGLVTWRGAHSWVMSGFTATADPAHTDRYRVKAVNIQDTWYPYVSTIWGASRPPNTLVSVGKLREDFLPYARPRARYPRRDGKYMLILPVLPEGTVAR